MAHRQPVAKANQQSSCFMMRNRVTVTECLHSESRKRRRNLLTLTLTLTPHTTPTPTPTAKAQKIMYVCQFDTPDMYMHCFAMTMIHGLCYNLIYIHVYKLISTIFKFFIVVVVCASLWLCRSHLIVDYRRSAYLHCVTNRKRRWLVARIHSLE